MAALRYTSDAEPGITRLRRGRGFVYRWPDRRPLRDPATLARIRRLAIPPAWTEVWISLRANGHVQATGRDQRGRKQYRYHPRWPTVRDETKYDRLLDFGRALPELRRQVRRDLARPGLPHRKVLALVVHLLEKTLIRVGNDEYAAHNGSFGLTTCAIATCASRRPGPLRVPRQERQPHDVAVARPPRWRASSSTARSCPARSCFKYVDDDGRAGDDQLHRRQRYLRAATGQAFTAKDFRTWAGTVLAARALHEAEPCPASRPGSCGAACDRDRRASARQHPHGLAGAATFTRR